MWLAKSKTTDPYPNENHSAIAACKEVAQICAPLNLLTDISLFSYMKGYWGDRMLSLSSREDWARYYWEHNLHQYASVKKKDLIRHGVAFAASKLCQPGSEYHQKVITPLQEIFDINHMMILVKYHFGYTEMFGFAAPKKNTEFQDFFIENKVLFEKFIIYFKSAAKHLIDQAEKELFPTPPQPDNNEIITRSSKVNAQPTVKDNYLQTIKTKRFYLHGKYDGIYLTQREVDCIYLLILGMAYKEIARALKISPRSVEKYITESRVKLDCKSKKELIEIAKANKISRFVDQQQKAINYATDYFTEGSVDVPGVCHFIQNNISLTEQRT